VVSEDTTQKPAKKKNAAFEVHKEVAELEETATHEESKTRSGKSLKATKIKEVAYEPTKKRKMNKQRTMLEDIDEYLGFTSKETIVEAQMTEEQATLLEASVSMDEMAEVLREPEDIQVVDTSEATKESEVA
ncbi:hypothetical protein A2U01_0028778, partial [Trifolium medium]|nr:hypothetical protein [Trifolium medium]